uniref:Uncharacterized protein n=1 Tax=Trichogramma kaykai TaxID=54128 RepID=A0ABD2WNE5_9HYME
MIIKVKAATKFRYLLSKHRHLNVIRKMIPALCCADAAAAASCKSTNPVHPPLRLSPTLPDLNSCSACARKYLDSFVYQHKHGKNIRPPIDKNIPQYSRTELDSGLSDKLFLAINK